MNIVSIILNAAKAAHVSGTLLLAICSHESANFKYNYSPNDAGSPSHGVCQLKESTARMLGFNGKTKDLMTDKINARYAAKYLKYQEIRYNVTDKMTDKWVKMVSAYNAGSYVESKSVPGCPRNLGYVRFVQKKLPTKLQNKLNCGG